MGDCARMHVVRSGFAKIASRDAAKNGQTMLVHKYSKNATKANERSHFGADYVKILSKSVFHTLQTRENAPHIRNLL